MSRVFTDHFIQKYGYSDTYEMREDIEQAFANRVKALRDSWNKSAQGPYRVSEERSEARRYGRKSTVAYFYQICLLCLIQ